MAALTAATADAVRQLLARGIPFVLVSARMPEAILPITRALGIDIPLVCYSGALALTAAGEELLSRRMPLPAVRETLGICDRAYIISDGGVIAAGSPEEIINNESVRKVYLGEHFRL